MVTFFLFSCCSTDNESIINENNENAAKATNKSPAGTQTDSGKISNIPGRPEKDRSAIDLTLDEYILKILGEDPSISKEELIKIHPSLMSRWKVFVREGLSEEARKGLITKYPRTGDLHTEPPKVNLEIQAAL